MGHCHGNDVFVAVAAAVSKWQELKLRGGLDEVEEEEDIYTEDRMDQVLLCYIVYYCPRNKPNKTSVGILLHVQVTVKIANGGILLYQCAVYVAELVFF